MATQAVNDWIVSVGWDDSKVVSGSKKLQTLMSKLSRLEKIEGGAAKAAAKKQESTARNLERMDQKRLRAQQLLFQLKKIGGTDKEATALQNKLNATKTLVGYNKAILATQEAILQARKREYAENARIREQRKADMEAAKAAKMQSKGAAREATGAFSRISYTDPTTINNRIQDLVNLEAKLRGAMRKLPQDVKFDQQRQYIRQAIADIGKLQAAYRQAGTTRAFKSLSTEYRRIGGETQMLVRQTNSYARAMNAQKFAADKLRNSVHNLAASYLSVFAAIEGGRRFMEIGAEFETFDAMMLGVSGTARQAGKDFAFVSAQALRLGSDLTESTKSFAKFGTAATLSEIDPATVRRMFTQILEVNRAFGLTKERQGLVFLSMEQMLSKNVVSMEELKFRLAA